MEHRRVLFLHGWRTSADIMKIQCRDLLPRPLPLHIEPHFVDANRAAGGPPQAIVAQVFEGPYFEWWDTIDEVRWALACGCVRVRGRGCGAWAWAWARLCVGMAGVAAAGGDCQLSGAGLGFGRVGGCIAPTDASSKHVNNSHTQHHVSDRPNCTQLSSLKPSSKKKQSTYLKTFTLGACHPSSILVSRSSVRHTHPRVSAMLPTRRQPSVVAIHQTHSPLTSNAEGLRWISISEACHAAPSDRAQALGVRRRRASRTRVKAERRSGRTASTLDPELIG